MVSTTQDVQSQRLAVLSGLRALTNPKNSGSCQQERPPAYTPPARSGLFGNITSCCPSQNTVPDSQSHDTLGILDPIPRALSEDDIEKTSPVSLRISTRINIAGDGNIIALDCTPADQAKSIARAIIEAIQGRDWTAGLPMIDENGRPRPVMWEIDAGLKVEGSSNVVGTEPVINNFLRRGTQPRKGSRQFRSESSDSAMCSTSPAQRRRTSEVDATEERARKRARSEE